jgi:hypothetical protein
MLRHKDLDIRSSHGHNVDLIKGNNGQFNNLAVSDILGNYVQRRERLQPHQFSVGCVE